MEVFKITNDTDYLIHSLRLVKATKALFTSKIDEFYELGKVEVFRVDKPFIQKEIIVQLFSLNPEQTKIEFKKFLKDEIIKQNNKHQYSGVFWLIECLLEIKIISKTESKILHAENYEYEGDFMVKSKEPNTYYPTILEKYLKGLRELKSIQCDENFRKRLESKVQKEQKEILELHSDLSQAYQKTNESLGDSINRFGDSCLEEFKIFDFKSGFNGLISFPLYTAVDSEPKKSNDSIFSKFFDAHIRIDSKGKVAGKTNSENFKKIESYRIWRECVINFLRKAKWRMDSDKILNRDTVFYHILEKCDSEFIPADRKWLFANGIYHGFNNDFVTSAHILVPQLENSLKYVLENNGFLTSKIYDEVQHDNTLGGLLDMFVKGNNHEIFYELKDFLIENSSINFRNELCHGLLPPFIIEHYGVYVWWLTLKLIINKENVFELESV